MRPVPYQSPDKGSFFFVAKARFQRSFPPDTACIVFGHAKNTPVRFPQRKGREKNSRYYGQKTRNLKEEYNKKTLLRVLVLVLTNLLTLPFNLAALAILLVSERSGEENDYLNEYAGTLWQMTKKWIQTGKLNQTEEESE